MDTRRFAREGAVGFFTPTGFEPFYWRSVRVSRFLSRLSSPIELPPTVELPVDRPALIAANHTSLFDLVASLVTLGNYGVVARIGVNSRFFEAPIAGGFLRRLGCIPFSRDDRSTAEDTMVDALEAGQVCAIMPEGKIVRAADKVAGVGAGRPGISRIARRAGAAIVPVGFSRSDLAWPPGSRFPRVGLRRPSVLARIGTPFELEGDDHDANAATVMGAIGELVLAGRAAA